MLDLAPVQIGFGAVVVALSYGTVQIATAAIFRLRNSSRREARAVRMGKERRHDTCVTVCVDTFFARVSSIRRKKGPRVGEYVGFRQRQSLNQSTAHLSSRNLVR